MFKNEQTLFGGYVGQVLGHPTKSWLQDAEENKTKLMKH